MAQEPKDLPEGTASAASDASAAMIEASRRAVVQVRAGDRGAGAGVIWPGDDGLVLTNHHVTAAGPQRRPRGPWGPWGRGGRRGRGRARGPVRESAGVTLEDGRAFDAEVVRSSRGLDLALLRLPGGSKNLPPAAPVGDSEALRVGELVYAIGHPWGSLGAVTAGIVSGVGVTGAPGRGPAPGASARYVQSDVSLALGNSGGPLLNARGEVVGINAMIFGSLALSIPSNTSVSWLAGADEGRPRLGVALVPAVPARGARPAGLVVAAVEGGSPADRAGLMVGDVLLEADGGPLGDVGSLVEALAGAARAGGSVALRIARGGRPVSVRVALQKAGRAA